MNRRVQDGLKVYFLCVACEDRFSKHETAFSRRIFHPYVRGNTQPIAYGEYFLKFLVSVSWRILAYAEKENGLAKSRALHGKDIDNALRIWGDYLHDRRADVGAHPVHVVPIDGVVAHNVKGVPSNINRYLRRCADVAVFVSDDHVFTYANLASLLVIGIIVFPQNNEWENTEILREGYFTRGVVRVPGIILHHLMSRCARLAELERTISPDQLKIIERSYEKNRRREKSSQTRDAAILDILLSERSRRSS